MAITTDSPDGELASLATEPPERNGADIQVVDRGEPVPGVRLAVALGLTLAVVLAALVGWFGYRTYQSHQDQQQRDLFGQVARQGALNLTTIHYAQADADVHRIVESTTGAFRDDFQKRSQPFIDVVKQAQSKSQGSIIEAGIESAQGDQAQVLVAVNVNSSFAGVAEPQPRAWRMRITVQRVGDGVKVANVEFVQ
jgi:Mce-associated membrane protein